MKSLVVLISNVGRGSNLKALIAASRSKKINAKIAAVVCDAQNAVGLKHAKKYKIPVKFCNKKENLLKILKKINPDYIVLTGWKQIITDEVITFYPNRILNLHPGLIPSSPTSKVLAPDKSVALWNKGLLANKAIKNFMDKKSTYAGSSIHFLTYDFDFGPVLERTFEKIKDKDTVETLYARLKKKEHKIYIKALEKLTKTNSQKAIVMIVDGGGRAHALAKKYLESEKVGKVIAVPGNSLMNLDGIEIFPNIKTTEVKKITKLVRELGIDLVDVAQDDAIAAGLVNLLQRSKVKVFGPSKKASQIEWDKSFARKFMKMLNLPIPKYKVFNSQESAIDYLKNQKSKEFFIKASGLVAGKGAIYAGNHKESVDAVKQMTKFGLSGRTFLIEEKLTGEEYSAFAIVSGRNFQILGYAQDHKAVFDGDRGPNTGGMGCTSAPKCITPNIKKQTEEIIKKTVNGLIKLKRPYIGILYLGGMIVGGKVYIIEYNARWGEPEAQAVLPSIKNDYFSLINQALETYSQRNRMVKKIKLKKDKLYRVVVTAAAKGYPGDSSSVVGKEIKGFRKLLDNKKVQIYGTRIHIEDGKFISGGSRLFYVMAEGKDVAQARKIAYNALSHVSIEGGNLHYRTDIGYRDLQRLNNDRSKTKDLSNRRRRPGYL